MIDLTQKLLDMYSPRIGKVGRYSCSKIWGILNGYCTPEQYINGEEIDFKSAMNMWQGTTKHAQIQQLLEDDYFLEYKRELKVGDFTIVGMADALNWEEILEIKTSEKVHDKAKPWAVHQLKLYLTLFERPKGRIVQPLRTANKLYLKELGEYKRDDTWFYKEMEKLNEFHKVFKGRAKSDTEYSQVQGELTQEDINKKLAEAGQ